MTSRLSRIAFGLVILLPLGCGRPTMATVTGRVTCNGKPVKEAAITFSPVPEVEGAKESGKPATGFTDADGNFILSTFKKHDGALIGNHRVLVMIDDTNPAKCKREKRTTYEVKPGENKVTIEMND